MMEWKEKPCGGESGQSSQPNRGQEEHVDDEAEVVSYSGQKSATLGEAHCSSCGVDSGSGTTRDQLVSVGTPADTRIAGFASVVSSKQTGDPARWGTRQMLANSIEVYDKLEGIAHDSSCAYSLDLLFLLKQAMVSQNHLKIASNKKKKERK